MATLRLDIDAAALEQLDKRVRLLTDRNLRYVAAKAMTAAAQHAQQQLKQATPRYIQSPTRWTLGGTFVRFARADDLTTEVGFRQDRVRGGSPAGRYLNPIAAGTQPQIKGADLSASKLARQAPGAVLIPAKGSGLLNSAGNVSLSKYAAILGGVRQGGGQYFIGPVRKGSTTMAVFERKEAWLPRSSTIERSTRRLFTIDPNPKTRRAQFPVRQVLEGGFASAWRRELAAAFDAEVRRKLGGR